MKKFTLFAGIFVLLFVAQVISAQSINTQGVLRDANGYAMDDGTYSVSFRIYDSEFGGTLKWNDTYNLQVTNGVFSVTLGDGGNPVDMLSDDQPYWISMEIGTDGELTPRLKLNTTPYEMNYLTGNQNTFPGTGNVGIGTLTPGAKLEVSDGTNKTQATGNTLGFTRSGGPAYIWATSPGGYLNFGVDGLTPNDANSNLTLLSDKTSVFRGNVGIGTTSPEAKLDVRSNSTTTDVYELSGLSIGNIGRSSGNQIPGNRVGLAFRQYMSWDDYDIAGVILTGNNGNNYNQTYMSFYTSYQDGTYPSELHERMRITAQGNVGVGTETPAAKLDVRGDIKFGNNGQHNAVASEQPQRIITGLVTAEGNIHTGTGFTVSRLGEGKYGIYFDTAFPAGTKPAVTVSGVGSNAVDNMWSIQNADNVHVDVYSTDYVEDEEYEYQDCPFMFIAIGQR